MVVMAELMMDTPMNEMAAITFFTRIEAPDAIYNIINLHTVNSRYLAPLLLQENQCFIVNEKIPNNTHTLILVKHILHILLDVS